MNEIAILSAFETVAVLDLHLGGSGVAMIAAGGARTYIATVNHP